MTLVVNQPQTILHKKAGHSVPKEFFETAIRHCPDGSGFAIRDVTDGKTTLEVDRFGLAVTADNLVSLEDKIKEFEAVFWFGKMSGKHTDEDLQPYTLGIRENETSEPEVILSFFVEGDFPNHTKDNGHTDEYNFVYDVVMPKLEEAFEDVDGDIGKFTAKLHRPTFEKDLLAHVGHRAVFLFLPLEGDVIMFGDSKGLAGEFEWGSASQVHDYGQKKEEPIIETPAAAKTKKFSLFGAKPAAEVKVTTDDKGVHHTEPVIKDKPAIEAPKTEAGRTLVEINIPNALQGDARNRWMRLMNCEAPGALPKNHHSIKKMWVYPEFVPFAEKTGVTTKAHVSALEQDMMGIKRIPIDMKAAHTEIEKAKVSGDYPPTPKADVNDRTASGVAFMSDTEMTEQTQIVSSILDRDKVPSALEIQKMEADIPLYSDKLGIPQADLKRFMIDDIKAICKGNMAAVALIVEWRQIAMKYESLMGVDKVKDLVGTHVEAKTILKPDVVKTDAPSKRSLLFGAKKAS